MEILFVGVAITLISFLKCYCSKVEPLYIAAGSTGIIYKMTSTTVKKIVFDKKLLLIECESLTKLQHVHIIKFIECNPDSLLLEYCENGDMYKYVELGLPEHVACHYFKQLMLAIDHCHSHGFAHRDIKLENMLLTKNWTLRLCDFGFCSREKMNDTFCGTREYASPEIMNHELYNPMIADIWSAGVTLYCMIHSNFPYKTNCQKIDYTEWEEYCLPDLKKFLNLLLVVNPINRSTSSTIVLDPWLKYSLLAPSYMASFK
jgi:serine/threonine protein kinase